MKLRVAHPRRAATLVVASLVALAGCGADAPGLESTGSRADPIVGGTKAKTFEEAALVDVDEGGAPAAICSGVVIAPRAVLTAGHCVDGFGAWRVYAPYAGDGQGAYAWKGVTFDYEGLGQAPLTPGAHDVGLVFLDQRIDLAAYPTIASAKLPDGSEVVQIGRIDDGIPSMHHLFASPPITVQDGAISGFPYDYSTYPGVAQEGDSGGPSLVPGASPRTLVAVTSGQDLVARVDLVRDWILEQVALHEAEGAGGAGGGGGAPPVRPEPPAKVDAGATGAAGGAPGGDAGDEAAKGDVVSTSSCAAGRSPARGDGAAPLIALAAAAIGAARAGARGSRSSTAPRR